MTGERTSSESDGGAGGNDVTYDDVRINSTKKPRKKAPPPKPPQQPKYSAKNEVISGGITLNVLKDNYSIA